MKARADLTESRREVKRAHRKETLKILDTPFHLFRGQHFPDEEQGPNDAPERAAFLVTIRDTHMRLNTMGELNQVRVMGDKDAAFRRGIGQLVAVLHSE
jgi:hypothetical protein